MVPLIAMLAIDKGENMKTETKRRNFLQNVGLGSLTIGLLSIFPLNRLFSFDSNGTGKFKVRINPDAIKRRKGGIANE